MSVTSQPLIVVSKKNPEVVNINALANAEVSFEIPSGKRAFVVNLRTGLAFRVAFEENETATSWLTTHHFESGSVETTLPLTIYLRSPKADLFEILLWE